MIKLRASNGGRAGQVSVEQSNRSWIEDLEDSSESRNRALNDLRSVLEDGLPYALSQWVTPSDPGYESFIQDVIQDTLVRVTERYEQFRGRSKFTTWVFKIAIRIALSEIRRKRWSDVSLEQVMGDREHLDQLSLMAEESPGPELNAEQKELVRLIGGLMLESLTDRQRKALVAVAVKGMPTEEVARRMGTNRNALYKLIHDARLKLKEELARQGLTPDHVLDSFGG